MDPVNDYCTICCLPDEIILHILQYNDYQDLVRFSMTCKRFKEVVLSDKVLWKNVYRKYLPDMVETLVQNGTELWYKEVKQYFKLKNVIYSALSTVAADFYDRINTVHFMDVCSFINVYTLSRSQNYFYSVSILQDMIKKTEKMLITNTSTPPFTLTEMHYAKTAVRYYFHAYLALQWIINSSLPKNPSPLKVINFFVQWVYNKDLDAENYIDKKIKELTTKVDDVLKMRSKGVTATNDDVSRVFMAINEVLFKQRHFVSVSDTVNYDTLDAAKALQNKCGHHILILAMYQAIAHELGVYCELQVFPNHLYLEWRADFDDDGPGYIVDVNTGKLRPKGGCPFSRNRGPNNGYRYDHNRLIEYLHVEYQRYMGYLRDWQTENAGLLVDFLQCEVRDGCVYGVLMSAIDNMPRQDFLRTIQIPLEYKYLSSIHMGALVTIFKCGTIVKPIYRERTLKRHPSCIKFAVGMICTHVETHYKCVILRWDTGPLLDPNRRRIEVTLPQPHYFVIDINQCKRYVAQDLLTDDKRPSRLAHLEDALAQEFSHFDGFRYVPNPSKQAEYPDDDGIAMMYRSHAGI